MSGQGKVKLLLRSDTIENWEKSTIILFKGEGALCETLDEEGKIKEYRIKYGDGIHLFKDLPWVSALPSDIGDSGVASVDYVDQEIEEVKNIISALHYKKITINSFSLMPTNLPDSRNYLVVGDELKTGVLTWSTSKEPAAQTLTFRGETVEIDPTLRTQEFDYTEAPITTATSWTLKVADPEKPEDIASKSVSATFNHYIYYGATARPVGDIYDNTFVNSTGLSKTPRTSHVSSFKFEAQGEQYAYYISPVSFGEVTFWAENGLLAGFESIGQITNVSLAGEAVCDYNVYRSSNANLGQQTITVKKG